MILTVDIGNTNIVIGCIENGKNIFMDRLSTNRSKTLLEYAIDFKSILEIYHIDTEKLEGGIISSVVPPVTGVVRSAIEKVTGKSIMLVEPGIKTGLNILMDNPAQVGSDLIVNAIAAIHEYKTPLIIVDMGTATTISVVDENKNYIGGMILPGLKVSLESLVSGTSQLPRISLESCKRLIGKNTTECMKSGVIYGNASCIDGMIARIQEELKQKATVVATGGLAAIVAPYCKENVIYDDELLLKGLYLIYCKNK